MSNSFVPSVPRAARSLRVRYLALIDLVLIWFAVALAVALRLENSDTQRHSFDIDAFDVHVTMPINAPALALFTPNAPGTYTFYCRIPGHTEAGMVGTLIVEP